MMSEFKKAVLNAVKHVPQGKVVSYGQIALLAGVPRAARQVGTILCQYGEGVPWWRVINNAGRISINCLDHGASLQKEKLESEGIKVGNNLNIEIEKYRWLPDKEVCQKLELSEEKVHLLLEKYF